MDPVLTLLLQFVIGPFITAIVNAIVSGLTMALGGGATQQAGQQDQIASVVIEPIEIAPVATPIVNNPVEMAPAVAVPTMNEAVETASQPASSGGTQVMESQKASSSDGSQSPSSSEPESSSSGGKKARTKTTSYDGKIRIVISSQTGNTITVEAVVGSTVIVKSNTNDVTVRAFGTSAAQVEENLTVPNADATSPEETMSEKCREYALVCRVGRFL